MEARFQSSDALLLESGLFADATVTCGERTWRLHRAILCTRSRWFNKALNGHFEEAKTGNVEIKNFDPELIGWLITYIYTGVCDISKLRPDVTTKTNFTTCIEVYTIADYFQMEPLANIALSTLAAQFDSRLPALQLSNESDWMDELFDAIAMIYDDMPIVAAPYPRPSDASQSQDRDQGQGQGQCRGQRGAPPNLAPTGIRAAFLAFIHTARFAFLQRDDFARLLDALPAFALDLFRNMRTAGDFVANLPDPTCSTCRVKPSRSEKGYYTHIAPDRLKLCATCASCAVKKELPPPGEDWMGKRNR